MKTVTYKCDRCKKVIDYPKEQLWNLGIGMACEPRLATFASTHWAQWCRPCVEHCGLAIHTEGNPPVADSPPTLEDLIREIVREELPE